MNDYEESFLKGTIAENLFIDSVKKLGWEYIRHASKYEDRVYHWDLMFRVNGKIILVDVKSHRDTYRDSGVPLKDYFVIEWKNINGKRGWLEGDANYIVFEYFGEFLIYNRKTLREVCLTLVDFSKRVFSIMSALNAIYTRNKRKDQISLVKISDLPMPNKIISK